MNPQERAQIKSAVRSEHGIKIVTDLYAEIIGFFSINPGAPSSECLRTIESNSAMNAKYRAINKLKEYGILTAENEVKLTNKPRLASHLIVYPLPSHIKAKNLPPRQFKWVHIASYLSRLEKNDEVLATGKTKKEVINEFQQKFLKDEEALWKMTYELQERLAVCAILADNLDNFKDMKGSLNLEGFSE